MKKRHFIVLFLFLFVISVAAIFANNHLVTEASDDANKDKIETMAQNVIKETSQAVGESVSVLAKKTKEGMELVYEVAKEKGEAAFNAVVVKPSVGLARSLVKKALSSASSSILTSEDVEEVLSSKDNNCSCQ